MKKYWMGSFAVASLATLSACGSHDNQNDNPLGLPEGKLRVVNAILGSNTIDATVENANVGSFNNIAADSGTGFSDIPDGSYKVQLVTDTNAGQFTITNDNTSIDTDKETTVYAIGTNGNNASLGSFAVEKAEDTVSANNVEVQFVDAASVLGSQASTISVYLTTPGQALSGLTPLSLQLKGSSAPTQIPLGNGTFEIRIFNGNTQIYDSGSAGFTLSGGSSIQFAVLDANAATSGAPVMVYEMPSTGNNVGLPPGI